MQCSTLETPSNRIPIVFARAEVQGLVRHRRSVGNFDTVGVADSPADATMMEIPFILAFSQYATIWLTEARRVSMKLANSLCARSVSNDTSIEGVYLQLFFGPSIAAMSPCDAGVEAEGRRPKHLLSMVTSVGRCAFPIERRAPMRYSRAFLDLVTMLSHREGVSPSHDCEIVRSSSRTENSPCVLWPSRSDDTSFSKLLYLCHAPSGVRLVR